MVLDLKQYRDRLVSNLATLLGAPYEVKTHPGRFDLGEVNKYAAKAPCLRVAVLAAPDAQLSQPYVRASVVVYLLTKRSKTLTQDEALLVLGTIVYGLAWAGGLGGPDAQSPQGIGFRNLYTTATGDEGIALGVVEWTQVVEMPVPASIGNVVAWLQNFVDYDLAPADGLVDASDHQSIPQ